MTHKRFNFKSSGRKITNRKFSDPVIVEKPIGIKTPLEFGKGQDDLYRMHTNPGDQIKDNLRNLILTNYGERLGRANFGANLISMLYDMAAIDKFEAEANQRIVDAAKKHIPAVMIKEVKVINSTNGNINTSEITGDSYGLALVLMRVNYDIPRVKIFNQFLEVMIYVGG